MAKRLPPEPPLSPNPPTPPCPPDYPPPPPHPRGPAADALISVGVILAAAAVIALVMTYFIRHRHRHQRRSLNAIIARLNELHAAETNLRAQHLGVSPEILLEEPARTPKRFREKIGKLFSQNSARSSCSSKQNNSVGSPNANNRAGQSNALFPDIETISGRFHFFEDNSERRYYPRQSHMNLPDILPPLAPVTRAPQRRFQSEPWTGPLEHFSEIRGNNNNNLPARGNMIGRPLPSLPVSTRDQFSERPVLYQQTKMEFIELSKIRENNKDVFYKTKVNTTRTEHRLETLV